MRKKIVRHLGEDGERLDPLVKEAVERVRATLPTRPTIPVSAHLRRQVPRIPSRGVQHSLRRGVSRHPCESD
jgi:hypothetical protein